MSWETVQVFGTRLRSSWSSSNSSTFRRIAWIRFFMTSARGDVRGPLRCGGDSHPRVRGHGRHGRHGRSPGVMQGMSPNTMRLETVPEQGKARPTRAARSPNPRAGATPRFLLFPVRGGWVCPEAPPRKHTADQHGRGGEGSSPDPQTPPARNPAQAGRRCQGGATEGKCLCRHEKQDLPGFRWIPLGIDANVHQREQSAPPSER